MAIGFRLSNLLSISDLDLVLVLYKVVCIVMVPHGNPNNELDGLTIWVMASLKTHRKINLPTLILKNILTDSLLPDAAFLIYGHFLAIFFSVKRIALRGPHDETSSCLNSSFLPRTFVSIKKIPHLSHSPRPLPRWSLPFWN